MAKVYAMTPKQQELMDAVRDLQRYGALFREARDRVNELLREVCGEEVKTDAED